MIDRSIACQCAGCGERARCLFWLGRWFCSLCREVIAGR